MKFSEKTQRPDYYKKLFDSKQLNIDPKVSQRKLKKMGLTLGGHYFGKDYFVFLGNASMEAALPIR